MLIQNKFHLDLPPDEAWEMLLDVERVMPCLPGAHLESVSGDEYTGTVKVKVGSMVAGYRGTARFEEVDSANRTGRLVATGSETKGQGRAQATVDLAVVPDNGGSLVEINTHLQISGRVAQFGRSVMQDVSSKLIDQFATTLRAELAGGVGTSEPRSEGVGRRPREVSARSEPIDLLELGGSALARRALPLAAAATVAVIIGWLFGRRRGHEPGAGADL